MTHRPRDLYRDEAAEPDVWAQPGHTVALVLSSVAWVLWWAVSMIIGPIHLAARCQEREPMEDVWGSGARNERG